MNGRPHVLIVDDQPDNVEVLGGTLSEQCEVSFALSGIEALARVADDLPDLILLDLMMPEMDGYAVIAELKRDPRSREIPVIFVTARTDADSERQALAAGAVDFIHKPINPDVVLARVNTHLQIARQNRRLAEQLETLRVLSTAIEQCPASVMITDADVVIQYVNPYFEQISGYCAAEALGRKPSFLKSGQTDPSVYKSLWESLIKGQAWRGEMVNRRKNGELYIEESHIAPVKNAAGEIAHYVALKLDVTRRKEAEEKLDHLAHYDPLTDLPNRSLFFDRVERALAMACREGYLLALMFIDLDKFKPINDCYGHAVGDRVLQEVALRIKNCLRNSDTAGRVGGDEFVVLLAKIAADEDALQVGEKLRQALCTPILVDGLELSVSSSIGIAIYPCHGEDALCLARHADQAMYQAKQGGRDRVVLFQPAA